MEVPWWTPKCSALLQAVKATTTQRTRGIALRAFKQGTREARRSFYSEQVAAAEPSSIWNWTK